MEQPVDLELAKRLKEEGYSKPCEYFWQDRDLYINEDVISLNSSFPILSFK
jgi:hypothetical protein